MSTPAIPAIPANTPTGPKTMVVFKWSDGKSSTLNEGRIFLEGVPDLLYQVQIEQAELAIRQHFGPAMADASVTIVDWKPLHG